MKKKKDIKKPVRQEKTEDLAIERAIQATASEIHMGQYPIFCITTEKPTDTRMTYRERFKVGNIEVMKEWSIQVSAYYGWPGEHEAEVWRSIQHIAELRLKAGTLSNPIQTTLEEIREYMSNQSRGGQQRKAIVRSLHCLCDTRLETNYWFNAAVKVRQEAHFAIIASFQIEEKKLQSGLKVIDKIYIGFGPELFANLQSRYTRPLDKGFLDTKLNKWLSKRLYELLGPKFYGLRKKGVPYRIKYSRLCCLLGSRQQQYLSFAKRILSRAHVELQKEDFLEKIEWFQVLQEKSDWVLHYWPGPRAKAEWKKEFWWKDLETREPIFVEELPETETEPVFVEEPLDALQITATVVTEQAPDSIKPIVLKEEPQVTPNASSKAKNTNLTTKASLEKEQLKAFQEALKEDEEDSYVKAVIEAFEKGTEKHRRLLVLSDAERKCLDKWKNLGATPADVESGAKKAKAKALENSHESGRPPKEILSMAYINGHVLDAYHERVTAEQNALIQKLATNAFFMARASQTKEHEEAQSRFRKAFLKGSEGNRLKSTVMDLIVVTQLDDSGMEIMACNEEVSGILENWKKSIEDVAGCAVKILNPMTWAQQMQSSQKRF